VTVVATGLGGQQFKSREPETIEKPMRLVRNATTGQAEPGFGGEDDLVTETGEGQTSTVETKDMFSHDENIDYLDIPAFLRNQAD
jgi:cell division protein FtsZ